MLQEFTNEQFGKIRTILIDGEPYFAGKDVARALGFKDTDGAIRRHVVEDDKIFVTQSDLKDIPRRKNGVEFFKTRRKNGSMIFINRSGLFSLVLSSKLPKAQEFKHWITSEVIPTIMETGSYTMPGEMDMNEFEQAVYKETIKTVKDELDNSLKIQPLMKLIELTGNQKIRDRLIIKVAEIVLGEPIF